jgi:hypothetical protein
MCVACVQVIVPKRTALLLDRIMVALQKAVENEKGGRSFAPATVESKVCIVCHWLTSIVLGGRIV